jgi:hypothetical protein
MILTPEVQLELILHIYFLLLMKGESKAVPVPKHHT